MKVYVIGKNGKPLMPTTPARARVLLKQGRAKCVRRNPFTIKLLYRTTHYTQPCQIAVDTGSGTLGSAAVTDDGKTLYLSEVEVRNDIKKRMDRRRKYRRTRRSRKTRYRKARFDNRGASTRKDRFSPTMVSKLHTHEKEIAFIRKLLPCKKAVILETGTFDPAAMKNPALRSGKAIHWGYQKGPKYGFANTKAYVLSRDGYQCQHCHGNRKDRRLEVHHIIFRCNGGSDEPENLIVLCKSCHDDVHDGTITLKLSGRRRSSLLFATQMNSIRKQLLRRYPDAIETFGYITKENRQALGLLKRHCIDAAVVASGGNPIVLETNTVIIKKAIPEGDYQRTKGARSEKSIPEGKICGFKKFDRVCYHGKEYFIKGRMVTGYAVLMDIYGNKVTFSGKGQKTPKLSKMQRTGARKSWMVTTEALAHSVARRSGRQSGTISETWGYPAARR